MIRDERVHESRGLRGGIGMEVFAVEGGEGASERGFERSAVSKPSPAAERTEERLMQREDLCGREADDHFARARKSFARLPTRSATLFSNVGVTLPPS